MNPTFSIGDTRFEVLSLQRSNYSSNNALAVFASVEVDGDVERMPVSVNLDHDENLHASNSLQDGEFYAKNWSENAELYQALVNAGWLAPTGAATRTGFVRAPVCRLGENAIVK